MLFILTEDRNECRTQVKGIALDFQRQFKEFAMRGKIALKWQANFDHIDLNGSFELWLTDAEARQLVARIKNALGDSP